MQLLKHFWAALLLFHLIWDTSLSQPPIRTRTLITGITSKTPPPLSAWDQTKKQTVQQDNSPGQLTGEVHHPDLMHGHAGTLKDTALPPTTCSWTDTSSPSMETRSKAAPQLSCLTNNAVAPYRLARRHNSMFKASHADGHVPACPVSNFRDSRKRKFHVT